MMGCGDERSEGVKEEVGEGEVEGVMEMKMVALYQTYPLQSFLSDGGPEVALPGLARWKTANKLLQSYGTGNFKFFMPPDLSYPIGDTYSLVPPLPMDAPGVHMYRYHPLHPSPREAFLFTLLSQFHPYVFIQSRYGPRGSMAIVRARNDRYLDIMIRLESALPKRGLCSERGKGGRERGRFLFSTCMRERQSSVYWWGTYVGDFGIWFTHLTLCALI